MADPSTQSVLDQGAKMSQDDPTAADAAFIQQQLDFEQNMRHIDEYRSCDLKKQFQEDTVITEYKLFVKALKVLVTKELTEDASDEEVDRHCFPPADDGSFEALYALLEEFLDHVAGKLVLDPQSEKKASFETMETYYKTLAKRVVELYRQRYRKMKNMVMPSRKILEDELSQPSSFLVRHYGLSTIPSHNEERTYLGSAELAFLIDADLRTTKSIELTECHHLAWTLGRCCAVLPSSLGPSTEQFQDPKVTLPYLTFRDCRIHRDGDTGFVLKLKVRNLKTNNWFDIDRMQNNKTLSFTIKSPQSVENLYLSPTLRILAIALRRNALKLYSSIEELLTGKEYYIMFKDEFLDKPVMLESAKGGLGVTDQPARSGAFTGYLSRQGVKAGFLDEVTFLSICRQTASEWFRRFGSETTRQLMGHRPGSRTLGRDYLELARFTDVSAIAFNQSSSNESTTVDGNTLLLERLFPAQLQKMLDEQIPERVQQLKLEHPDRPFEGMTPVQKKSIFATIRRQATTEVMQQVKKEQLETLQHADVIARQEEVIRSETVFNQKLLDIAHEEGYLLDELSTIDQVASDVDQTAPIPENMAFRNELRRVPYQAATAVVLKMMLDNPLSELKPNLKRQHEDYNETLPKHSSFVTTGQIETAGPEVIIVESSDEEATVHNPSKRHKLGSIEREPVLDVSSSDFSRLRGHYIRRSASYSGTSSDDETEDEDK